MTVNDISKVDGALKNRPSRFKYVIEFPNPDLNFINNLINHQDAKKLLGMNLDQILTINQYLKMGCDLEDAVSRIEN